MVYIFVIQLHLLIQIVTLGAARPSAVLRSPYTSYRRRCSCETVWMHNSTPIYPRRGKYLISSTHIEILDLRSNDSGVYSCASSPRRVHTCGNFSLFVNDLDSDYTNIHMNTVPYDASEELPDRVYWHPRMKRTDVVNYFDYKPLLLSAYFYSTASTPPFVTWSGPTGSLLLPNQLVQTRILDCHTLEESHRPLNGVCYESSYTVQTLSTSSRFSCVVSVPNGNRIQAQFTVLKNMLHLLLDGSLPEREEADESKEGSDWFDDLPDPVIMDDFSLGFTTFARTPRPTTTKSSVRQQPETRRNGYEPPSSTTPVPSSLLTQVHLHPANWSEFEFFPLTSAIHPGNNFTLMCRLPRLTHQLELWYLGHVSSTGKFSTASQMCLPKGCYDRQPELLKVSESTPIHFVDGKGRIATKYQLSPSVFVTITHLDEDNTGTYLCRYHHLYRTVEVNLTSLTEAGTSPDFRPLAFVFVLIYLVLATLLSSLLICIRSLRKPVIAVFNSHGSEISSKFARVNISLRPNVLYPSSLFDKASEAKLVSPDDPPSSILSTNEYPDAPESHKPVKRRRTVFRPLISTNHIDRIGSLKANSQRLPPGGQRWEVSRSCIKTKQLIGEGSFGAVYEGIAVWNPSEISPAFRSRSALTTTVAIKTLKNNLDHDGLKNLMLELEIMKVLEAHPHIIRLLGVCTHDGPPMILMEFAKHGNLRDLLRRNRPASEQCLGDGRSFNVDGTACPQLDSPSLLRFARHVADAMTYLESLQLVHCDIAARNVLITENWVAKLSDFGFTRHVDDRDFQKNRERFPYRWMAPECFDGSRFTQKSDIWSFGIFLWELFTLGQVPYPGLSNAEIHDWLEAGNRNEQPVLANSSVYELMLLCWTMDPAMRPTFKEVLASLIRLSNSNLSATNCSRSLYTGHLEAKLSRSLRVCSLPKSGYSSEGYVEMRFEGYLEPRPHDHSSEVTLLS
ncbi:unnamed protein product [Dicrocoelium dendriticum]|nr:unnamed protein product [Dicrocoelium dendriticum]